MAYPDDVHVFGCDLFLLEHWDAASPLSADEQMMQIFARFVAMPIAQRLVYIRRAYHLQYASALPEADQDLLYRVRPYDERICLGSYDEMFWLRTYYGPGSDEALQEIVHENYEAGYEDLHVLSDPDRYNFGSNWQRIFHRMPQLLDVPPKYEARVRRARAKNVREARRNRAVLERDGHWPPKDQESMVALYGWHRTLQVESEGYLYSDWHMARQVGYIHVLDEKTLGAHWQDSDDDEGEGTTAREEKSVPSKSYVARRYDSETTGRELLCGWYDAHGTLLRWNRLNREEVFFVHGLHLDGCWVDDSEWLEASLDGDLPDPGFDTNPVSAADLEAADDNSESDGYDSYE